MLTSGGTAPDDLLSRRVRLNGARVASSSGLVPRLPPRRANGTVYVAPPKSVAFLRFETVPAACA